MKSNLNKEELVMTVSVNKSLLFKQQDILVVSIGSGTQDVLVYPADKIWLGDIDLSAFHQTLAAFDQPLPFQLAVAVQDHGLSTKESNRIHWWQLFAVSVSMELPFIRICVQAGII